MVTLAFGMSAGIGALAGCVVAPLTQTHYAIGAELAIKGFTVAAFGGLGNSVAAVAAGLFLGMLESFSIIVGPRGLQGRRHDPRPPRRALREALGALRFPRDARAEGLLKA
jgi:branched-subunit amino acid ABC-type transport system permease component